MRITKLKKKVNHRRTFVYSNWQLVKLFIELQSEGLSKDTASNAAPSAKLFLKS